MAAACGKCPAPPIIYIYKFSQNCSIPSHLPYRLKHRGEDKEKTHLLSSWVNLTWSCWTVYKAWSIKLSHNSVFMLNVKYGYGQSSTTRNRGGSVAVTTRYVALVRHEEEITMAELFEEKFCKLVRNFKHIVFVFNARGTLSISPPQSPCLFLSLLLS